MASVNSPDVAGATALAGTKRGLEEPAGAPTDTRIAKVRTQAEARDAAAADVAEVLQHNNVQIEDYRGDYKVVAPCYPCFLSGKVHSKPNAKLSVLLVSDSGARATCFRPACKASEDKSLQAKDEKVHAIFQQHKLVRSRTTPVAGPFGFEVVQSDM